jgi:hypothetical protein
MTSHTPMNSAKGLDEVDQELRRHIARLLEIDVGNGDATRLIYDAVQSAARLGQEIRARRRALEAKTPASVTTEEAPTSDDHTDLG